MIDLHLHTTASDGVLAPSELVAQAARAGITTLSVTDHDTTAGLAAARAAAARLGAAFVNGIEITAIERGRDVHVLGYFFDADNTALHAFLEAQRTERRRRVMEIVRRLNELDFSINAEHILKAVEDPPGRSVGRPAIADALVAAGRAAGRSEAFDLWLGEGRPAFVPRRGAGAREVIDVIHDAGGLASIAHPGLLQMDDLVEVLAACGLDAIEARHSDHDAETEAYYRGMAERLGVAVSGGSDFHGEAGRARELGEVVLPERDFEILSQRAGVRARP